MIEIMEIGELVPGDQVVAVRTRGRTTPGSLISIEACQ